MTVTNARMLNVGQRRIPVILPDLGDARLHTAAVIISIHVVGITTLRFAVSVPQILCAILTASLIDLILTFRRTRSLIWPASGMLTGSGVALILRAVGMDSGDFWSWRGWHYFALVAGFSVLTKYLVRYRGSHVFNPSNVGLVVGFLVLGSGVVEPLDFWWAPLDTWMIVAYLIIMIGGFAITRRLRLLETAVTFWVVLAAGLGVLAASSHCMTATWSLTPVCGSRFWTVLVTSPEVLIFLFFMITDPKTVPVGRVSRTAFAASLAILSTVLIAPQSVEFGAKVALLAGLVVMTPIRGLFDRFLADAEVSRSGFRNILALINRAIVPGRGHSAIFLKGAAAGSALVLVGVVIVAAGTPARGTAFAGTAITGQVIDFDVEPSRLPPVTLSPDLVSLNSEIDVVFANKLAVTLAENLGIEGEATLRADGSLLATVDGGERLAEMQRKIEDAIATGERVVAEYSFDSLHVEVAAGDDGQAGPALGLDAVGSVEEITYDAFGEELSRSTSSFSSTFVLRQLGGDRWLIVEVVPQGD